MHADIPDTLSIAEAATLSQVSTRTVRRWIASGQVVTRGHGRDRRIVSASLSKLADNRDMNGHVSSDSGRTDGHANGHTGIRDTEAVHLSNLVRDLAVRLSEQTAIAAMWQERARVLGERLALGAPESVSASNLTREPQNPTPEPSTWLSWTSRWPVLVSITALAIVAVVVLVVGR